MYAIGLEGVEDYMGLDDRTADYVSAARKLKLAIDYGHEEFSSYFADICARNLGGPRTLEEAVEYYLRAARAGDGTSASLLYSLVPDYETKP